MSVTYTGLVLPQFVTFGAVGAATQNYGTLQMTPTSLTGAVAQTPVTVNYTDGSNVIAQSSTINANPGQSIGIVNTSSPSDLNDVDFMPPAVPGYDNPTSHPTQLTVSGTNTTSNIFTVTYTALPQTANFNLGYAAGTPGTPPSLTTPVTVSGVTGGSITPPTLNIPAGYSIVSVVAPGGGTAYTGSTALTDAIAAHPTFVVGNNDFAVTVGASSQTVTYNAGAGSNAPTGATYPTGTTFQVGAAPTAANGYHFTGWSDGSKTFQPGDQYTMPATDVTFTAQYDVNPAPPAPAFGSPAQGSTVTTTTPSISGTGVPGATVTVTGGASQCQVVVDSNGFWQCPPTTLNEGQNITLSATQSVTNSQYSGTSQAATVTFTVNPNATTCTVTYGAGANGTNPPAAGKYDCNGLVTIPQATPNPSVGYAFAGWSNPSPSSTKPLQPGDTFYLSGQDVTLTAQYVLAVPSITTPTPNQLVATAKPVVSGDGAVPGATISVMNGTTTVCTATAGSDGSWTCTPTNALPTGQVTLTVSQKNSGQTSDTASVTFTVQSYTITFLGGGGIDVPKALTVVAGASVTIPTTPIPTWPGYTFDGWGDAATGDTYQPGQTFTPKADMTLIATWSDAGGTSPSDSATPTPSDTTTMPGQHTLQFDPNGGIGQMPPQLGNGGVVLPQPAFIRPGYSFVGWSASASGTAPWYSAGAVYLLTADTTLYATWTSSTTPPPTQCSTGRDATANGRYGTGAYSLSTSGCFTQYQADFQHDGNLVIYKTVNGGPQQAIWATGTHGIAAGGWLTVQGDGNMVIYAANSAAVTPVWATNTRYINGANGQGGYLAMQSDGNLVLYGNLNGQVIPLWASGTHGM